MKKYLLSIAVLMAATISFTSCDDDDDCPTCPPPATIVQNGVYVINEGSYYSQIMVHSTSLATTLPRAHTA